jgi:hypothetical protein
MTRNARHEAVTVHGLIEQEEAGAVVGDGVEAANGVLAFGEVRRPSGERDSASRPSPLKNQRLVRLRASTRLVRLPCRVQRAGPCYGLTPPLHNYAYCHANPLDNTDPTGEKVVFGSVSGFEEPPRLHEFSRVKNPAGIERRFDGVVEGAHFF